MDIITSFTKVGGVTRIERQGAGYIYRAIVPIEMLANMLAKSQLRYAPKYQRGYKNRVLDDMTPADYDLLLPIYDDKLNIKSERSEAMAVKYLMGSLGNGKVLYAPDVIWNARKDSSRADGGVKYDPDNQTLEIYTELTIPDSGHRHRAYYLLGRWRDHPEEIPRSVDVDGTVVTREEIKSWLDAIDLHNFEKHSVFALIYNLDAEEEGRLYAEFNEDAKPPSRAVALDLNQQKTPTRRFVYRLIDTCPIFGREEVETRSTTIGSKSRKLTTNATMEAAVRPYQARLAALEKKQSEYDDLVEFFCAFYTEWSNHFPAFKPGALVEERQGLREDSFAVSNIMFFPMFQIAFEFWEGYRKDGADWRKEKGWKTALAKLAGKDSDTGEWIMDRSNPAWHGKIMIRTFNQDGTPKGWSLSSTRQTRQAAYHYLREQAGIGTAKSA